jgi:hypothetical protein
MNFPLSPNVPNGLQVESTIQGFTILRRWTHGWQDYVFETFKTLFGLGLAALGVIVIFSGSHTLIGYLFWGILALTGLGFIYHALVHTLDTDIITATPEAFSNRNTPLPVWWMKDLALPLSEISRLELQVKTYGRRGKKEDENTYHTFDIIAFMKTGAQHNLVGGIYNQPQAQYIHGELVRYFTEKNNGRD